jgi:Ca-activated chloride channel family protein
MSCPTTETLEQLALGFLEEPAPVAAHVKSCAACAARMEVLGKEHAALGAAARAVALPKIQPPRARGQYRPPFRGVRPWKPFAAAAACLLGAFVLWAAIGGSARHVPRPDAVAAVPAPERPAPVGRAPTHVLQPEAAGEAEAEAHELAAAAAEQRTRESFSTTQERRRTEEEARLVSLLKSAEAARMEPAAWPRPSAPKPETTKLLDLTFKASPEPPKVEPPRPADPRPEPAPEKPAGEVYKDVGVNPAVDTARETLSTFALDVDTASYTKIRDFLKRGMLPPREAVRVEECLNYFRYQDAPPPKGEFAVRLEAAPSPFDAEKHLLRIAILAREVKKKDRKDFVLTLVIDVSGSMAQNGRLELVKETIRFLLGQLRPTDRMGLVVFSSSARTILEATPVARQEDILRAIEPLHPEQSTNAGDGLRQGYELADRAFDSKATHRVILFSDGVANTGVTDADAILGSVREHAGKGVWLTSIGVGMGNYNDALLERLANAGNGNYYYVDDMEEARQVFGEKLLGTLEAVAIDAKVQVEFDPTTVSTFRLLGYENRHVANRDFRNDKVDAGEVGAGHRVNALYEIALKPGAEGRVVSARLRYKEPGTNEMIEAPPESLSRGQVRASAKEASPSWRLAASVAQFAEVLRESPLARRVDLQRVADEASRAAGEMDRTAETLEFLGLVRKVAELRK